MKAKTAKQPKQTKAAFRLKDLKPAKNAKGGMKCQNNLKQMGIA